jgi:L-threonylcarbamoyladenylate synthase
VEEDGGVEKVKELACKLKLQGLKLGIMASEENKGEYYEFNVKSLGPKDDLTACATNLFSILREFDDERVDVIIAESVKEKGIGVAIMDRLRKAACSKE